MHVVTEYGCGVCICMMDGWMAVFSMQEAVVSNCGV